MIYIVKHKDYENPVPKGYKEIGVGYKYEGTGKNINHLNPYINEATAYYDLWKNAKDKTIGVVHYHRFFAENGEPLGTKRVNEILKDYDMIVTTPYKSAAPLYNFLKADLAPGKEMDLYHKYLELLYKVEPGFKEYMNSALEFYSREMMVANKAVFDDFCKGLFGVILPIAEKYHKEDSDSKTNPRLVGFITERFFSYWIVKNNLNVYTMDFIDV